MENKSKIIKFIWPALLILMAAIFGYLFFLRIIPTPMTRDTEITNYVVVDEFQGQDFSSVDDFRENSIKGPQYVDINDYELAINGLVNQPLMLKYQDILGGYNSYKKIATLNCVEGWSVKILWGGVLVRDILNEAVIKPEAKTIIFRAVDGYSTSFPVEYIMDNNIIMAYKMNDQVLRADRGFPFQLVAESKWGYKWIKWINEIELSSDKDFQGYWEKRGYSNSGDLDKPRFGN